MTISAEELQLAARNHGMPLEALRWDVTPVGMHYLLVHYDVPRVDEASWRLEVAGERALSLPLTDLRGRPEVRLPVTMECAGNGRAHLEPRPVSQPWLLEAVGNAEWVGTPLAALLEEAGVPAGACEVLFTGLDRGIEADRPPEPYARSLPLRDALGPDVLLAWGINGQPLPPQHGFPLRLIVPGWYGMTSVKWLTRIELLTRPYDGFQNATSYRIRASEDDPGTPVTRMEPRALMVPPGVPQFMSRRRFVELGTIVVEGRAWSGWAPVEKVLFGWRRISESGIDWTPDEFKWTTAELDPPAGPHSWRRWSSKWVASWPGDYVLTCRASDASGREQPINHSWNVGGYANNSIQRVPVTAPVSPPNI
jgi:sulfane dehydrogenase subunit SoxC